MDLKKYYTNPNFSGSFSGVNTFYRSLRTIYPNIKRKDVVDFMQTSDVYTLHKPVQKPRKFRRVYTKGIDYLYQADLVDMNKYKHENDGFRFIITMIDTFSKKAWAIPIKTKEGKMIVRALRTILLVHRPIKLQVDRGSEFYNQHFLAMLKKYNIKWYSTHSELKASIVERFNRTLKTRMFRAFTAQGSHRYLELLPQLVEAYNNSYHRSIGMKPNNVSKQNERMIRKRLFPIQISKPSRFKIKDSVRITRKKNIFQKAYEQSWSYEVFNVSRILKTNPKTYVLNDYKGNEITGSFYSNELQHVNKSDNVYPIEKVVNKRRRSGVTQYLVKFLGYPEEANAWINQNDLFDV